MAALCGTEKFYHTEGRPARGSAPEVQVPARPVSPLIAKLRVLHEVVTGPFGGSLPAGRLEDLARCGIHKAVDRIVIWLCSVGIFVHNFDVFTPLEA